MDSDVAILWLLRGLCGNNGAYSAVTGKESEIFKKVQNFATYLDLCCGSMDKTMDSQP